MLSNIRSNRAMDQNRRDKQWPRPRRTGFVWVAQPGPQVPPMQGYVLDRPSDLGRQRHPVVARLSISSDRDPKVGEGTSRPVTRPAPT